MQTKLIFTLPDEREEFQDAVNGTDNRIKYESIKDDIWNLMFRGRHKHGYNDSVINELLGLNIEEDTEVTKSCNELMDRLEEIYRGVIRDD
jgi:predicted secreted Zn-dependent protease